MTDVPLHPGRPVLHRHFTRDTLVWAPLTRVVSDDERGTRLWLATGSPVIRQVSEDGRGPRGMPFGQWLEEPKKIIQDVYRGPSTLKFHPRGAAYSVWWLFDAEGRFRAWYVNLEEPGVTWDDGAVAGIDLTDQDLDMWVWPDRRWGWKDEDELEERLAYPDGYWVSDPDAVWAQGRAIVPLIEAGEWPFDGTWTDFRPPDEWTIPEPVAEGWDRPRQRT
jgi:predicted RNA-binding protein associated with RNAse of E/G family